MFPWLERDLGEAGSAIGYALWVVRAAVVVGSYASGHFCFTAAS